MYVYMYVYIYIYIICDFVCVLGIFDMCFLACVSFSIYLFINLFI